MTRLRPCWPAFLSTLQEAKVKLEGRADSLFFSFDLSPNLNHQQAADFFSVHLYQIRLRNNTDKGGSVTASEWGSPWEGTALL